MRCAGNGMIQGAQGKPVCRRQTAFLARICCNCTFSQKLCWEDLLQILLVLCRSSHMFRSGWLPHFLFQRLCHMGTKEKINFLGCGCRSICTIKVLILPFFFFFFFPHISKPWGEKRITSYSQMGMENIHMSQWRLALPPRKRHDQLFWNYIKYTLKMKAKD